MPKRIKDDFWAALKNDEVNGYPQSARLITATAASGLFDDLLQDEKREKYALQIVEALEVCEASEWIARWLYRERMVPVHWVPSELRRVRSLPRPPSLPVVGHALDLLGDLRKFLTESYLELGPIFELRWPGNRMIVLAGVEANEFLSRKGKGALQIVGDVATILKRVWCRSWIDGHGWRRSRQVTSSSKVRLFPAAVRSRDRPIGRNRIASDRFLVSR